MCSINLAIDYERVFDFLTYQTHFIGGWGGGWGGEQFWDLGSWTRGLGCAGESVFLVFLGETSC